MSHPLPTASVLIPCYNAARHIRRVVECAMDQTAPPVEVIVVDDRSTDESVAILKDLPVKLIQHAENQGPARARNTALHAASGEMVVYFDADAYADRLAIEALLLEYQKPSVRPIGGVGGRGVEANILSVYDRWRMLHARQDFGLANRASVPYLFGLCMSFKRSALLEIGGFDPFYPINAGEDLDIGYRFQRAGYVLRYTPYAIVHHQHVDTEEKLKRIQYNWYFWSYLAKKRNGAHPWTLYAGTLRRLFIDTLADLILRHDPRLAALDLQAFQIKMNALLAAARSDKS